jgi:excisionase family DNA binding protein
MVTDVTPVKRQSVPDILIRPESGEAQDNTTVFDLLVSATRQEVRLRFGTREELPISRSLYDALIAAARALADNNTVVVASLSEEITTQTAAELLGMSHPHLVRRLESDELPFKFVDRYRRVRLADVLQFRDDMLEEFDEGMREIGRRTNQDHHSEFPDEN